MRFQTLSGQCVELVSQETYDRLQLLQNQIDEAQQALGQFKLRFHQLLSEPIRDLDSPEAYHQEYIRRLHRYNELKDFGQFLVGKLALLQGTTVASLYSELGLSLDD